MKRMQHLVWCTVALLLLAACQTSPMKREAAALQGQAKELESKRQYAKAAEAYLQAAQKDDPAAGQALRAKAAEMAWLGGNPTQAERILKDLNEGLLDATTRARVRLLSARMARAKSDYPRVVKLLDFPRTGLPTALDREIVALLTEAQQRAGNDRAQAELLIERFGNSRATNDSDRVWEQLLALSTQDLAKWLGDRPNPLARGWIELAYITKTTAASQDARNAALDKWENDFAKHPAKPRVPALRENYGAPVEGNLAQIAILLPRSGALEGVGEVIREGIEAARNSHPALAATELRYYDTAGASIFDVYKRAVSEGANWVLGPLDKSQVDALNAQTLSVPVLSLNFGHDATRSNAKLYQFALLPEDEALQAARLIKASGRTRAYLLTPENDWGERIYNAFTNEFRKLGGTLITPNTYSPGTDDFSVFFRDLSASADIARDPPAVFFAATPKQARLIRSQLKHYPLGAGPVFSTSHMYSGNPDPGADSYLDGTIYAEIPWLVGAVQADDPNLKLPIPHDLSDFARQQPRLFAFGFDSMLLALRLQGRGNSARPIEHRGLSGDIFLDGQRLHRRVSFAQFRGGTPIAYDAPSAADKP